MGRLDLSIGLLPVTPKHVVLHCQSYLFILVVLYGTGVSGISSHSVL
jgi:hypothetical protein